MKLGLGLGLVIASGTVAPPYVEPSETDDPPEMPPTGDPTPPGDTPTDPDTGNPEPGVDPDFTEATRIELADQKQTVIRTTAEPGTWGNAYVATPADGYDYWEVHIAQSTPRSATLAVGVTNVDLPLNGIPGDTAGALAYWSSGVTRTGGVDTSGFPIYGRGDKIMVARDHDTGRVWFGKNGTWLGSTPAIGGSGHQGTLLGDGPYYPFVGLYSTSAQVTFKFIVSRFAYSMPEGFYPLGKTIGAANFTSTATAFFTGDYSTRPFAGNATYPSALHVASENKTYFSWIGIVLGSAVPDVRVTSYDHTTGTWGAVYKVAASSEIDDEHGPPAWARDDEGYLYLFWGSHNDDQQWAISDSPDDISAWTEQTGLSAIDYTYPKPVFVGSSMYLFARDGTSATTRPLYVQSGNPSAGSLTFGAASSVVDFGANAFVYAGEFHAVGTDIHFIAIHADNGDTERTGVYYFVYDTTDGSVRNHADSFSVASGSLPVDLAEANANFRLFDHSTDRGDIPSLQFDSSGNPHVLFLDGTGTSFDLKHITHDGSSWSTPETVKTGIKDYNGSTGFIDIIALVPMASGRMAAWYPVDAGFASYDRGGDMMRKVRSAAGVWGAEETMVEAGNFHEAESGSYHLGHPFAIPNGHSEMRVMFTEITTTDTDSAAVAVGRFIHGDRGFAIRPAADPYHAYSALVADFSVGLEDQSNLDLTLTAAGNATVSGGKLLLDGTGDYVTASDHNRWTPGGDYTWEVFGLEFQSAPVTDPILAHWSSTLNQRSWALTYQGGALVFISSADGSSGAVGTRVSYTWSPATNTPYDIRVARSGNVFRMHIDGVMVASNTSATTFHNSTDPMTIGRTNGASPAYADIRLKGVRITRNTDRGATDASYTPDTFPLPLG